MLYSTSWRWDNWLCYKINRNNSSQNRLVLSLTHSLKLMVGVLMQTRNLSQSRTSWSISKMMQDIDNPTFTDCSDVIEFQRSEGQWRQSHASRKHQGTSVWMPGHGCPDNGKQPDRHCRRERKRWRSGMLRKNQTVITSTLWLTQ